jgi:hypothetical protein
MKNPERFDFYLGQSYPYGEACVDADEYADGEWIRYEDFKILLDAYNELENSKV